MQTTLYQYDIYISHTKQLSKIADVILKILQNPSLTEKKIIKCLSTYSDIYRESTKNNILKSKYFIVLMVDDYNDNALIKYEFDIIYNISKKFNNLLILHDSNFDIEKYQNTPHYYIGDLPKNSVPYLKADDAAISDAILNIADKFSVQETSLYDYPLTPAPLVRPLEVDSFVIHTNWTSCFQNNIYLEIPNYIITWLNTLKTLLALPTDSIGYNLAISFFDNTLIYKPDKIFVIPVLFSYDLKHCFETNFSFKNGNLNIILDTQFTETFERIDDVSNLYYERHIYCDEIVKRSKPENIKIVFWDNIKYKSLYYLLLMLYDKSVVFVDRKVTQSIELETYKMNSNPKGICVIISIETFINSGYNRDDVPNDYLILKKLFTDIGFEVNVYKNCELDEFNSIISKYSLMSHEKYDAFVLAMMSHGRLCTISTSDWKEMQIMDIVNAFNDETCPTLKNKPKLFFIQACQTIKTPEEFNVNLKSLLPINEDTLISLSTSPGCASYRANKFGTLYVLSLDKYLRYSDTDICVILLLIKKNVTELLKDCTCNQLPFYISTMNKLLKLC